MKTFRTILGILILLLGVLVIGERIYYHEFDINTLYLSIPFIIFGCLLLYHRGNTILFSEKKVIKIILAIILLIVSTGIHGHIQRLACVSKRCDFAVGSPFPMFYATDTNLTGLLPLILLLGVFLNFLFYYILSALLVRAFKRKPLEVKN